MQTFKHTSSMNTKYIKIKKSYILITLLSLVLFSCDLLDEHPISELSTINFYKTEDDAIMAVNACYQVLPIDRDFHIIVECATDNLLIKNPDSENFQKATYDSQSAIIENSWNTHYKMIYRCNTVLERVPQMSIKTEIKNQVLGEAHFLRALGFFNLVRMWGDVPMPIQSVKDVNDFSIEKTSKETVYDEVIIPDLTFAINNLPNNLSGSSRASKDAARSLLALVYLTRAGNDNSKTNYWEAARDTALAVINNRGGLTFPAIKEQLCGVYGDLFKKENKQHKEHIFSVQNVSMPDMGTELTTFYAASTDYSGADWIGTRWLHPTFFNSFEVVLNSNGKVLRRDDRLATGVHRLMTVTEKGVKYKMFWPVDVNPDKILDASTQSVIDKNIVGARNYYKAFWGELPPDDYVYAGKVPTLSGGTRNFNRCAVLKYDDPDATLKADGGANIPVIRYAEVLLIYAEAENELNPLSLNALIALNAIRDRAKLPPFLPITQQDFREQVMKERNSEFFAEHKRYFDLIRRERYIEVMNNSFVGEIIHRTSQHLFLPIPFNEIQANEKLNLDSQNPGW
ncbi:hypothetical protein MASR2M117_04200 [Paludibacter sp.]